MKVKKGGVRAINGRSPSPKIDQPPRCCSLTPMIGGGVPPKSGLNESPLKGTPMNQPETSHSLIICLSFWLLYYYYYYYYYYYLEPAKTQWGSFSLDQQKATCAQSEKSDVLPSQARLGFCRSQGPSPKWKILGHSPSLCSLISSTDPR